MIADLLIPLLIAGLVAAGLMSGVLLRLTRQPMAVTGAALGVGLLWALVGLPQLPDSVLSAAAKSLLGALVFVAALECRLSRLWRISPDAFRLATAGTALLMFGFAATGFILVPGLGLFPALMVGAALMLGGAPAVASPLMTAPVEDTTRVAARVEAAAVFVVGVPIGILMNAGAEPVAWNTPFLSHPVVATLGGFAFGGLAGLGGGRWLKIEDTDLPRGPLMLGAGVYLLSVLIGFDPVLAMVGAGIALSEETRLPATVRTRYWRTGEATLSPIALMLFGAVLAPSAITFDFLIWFMAIITVGVVRALARHFALTGSAIGSADRTFLIWFNGAPGVGSALMLLIFATTNAPLTERPMALAAATILVGLASTRLASRHLTRRLVQQTALARKRRYSAA